MLVRQSSLKVEAELSLGRSGTLWVIQRRGFFFSSRTPSPCWSLRPILSCSSCDSFSDTRHSPGIRRNYYDASLVFQKSFLYSFLFFFYYYFHFFLPFFEWSFVRSVYASLYSFSVCPLLEGESSTLVQLRVSHAFHGRHSIGSQAVITAKLEPLRHN